MDGGDTGGKDKKSEIEDGTQRRDGVRKLGTWRGGQRERESRG
jgi:hypothetical protein